VGTTTFLFVDQAGSTEQLSRLGDTVAQGIRRALFDLLRQAVEAHGGEEVDFGGDGLFCAFSSATDGVDAAVTMQQAVAAFNDRRPAEHHLAIRAGLHAGEPLVSEGGGYFGAAVVVAARLCSSAEPGQVRVSALVRALVEPRAVHRFQPVGALSLKGIPEPVEAAAVVWEPVPEGERQFPALLAAVRTGPFVGRATEMAAVLDAFGSVTGGGRRLVLVGGDGGVGVSRLIAEAAERLHQDGASVWAGTGRGPGGHLAAWAEAVDGWARSVPRMELRLAVGGRGGALAQLVPGLTELLPRPPVPVEPNGEAATLLMGDALDGLVARWSAVEPLVVVLDRLDRADPASLTVLRRLLQSPRPARLVVVGGYATASAGAPKVRAALADVPDAIDLRLTGLTEPDVAELLEALTGEPADGKAARAVLAETDGNPSYVLQMARSMRQEGITRRVEVAVGRAAELRTGLRLQRQEIALGLRELDELWVEFDAGTPPVLDPDGTPPAPRESPYRGLLAFTAADADTFFGREALVAEMVATLSVSRWLAVVGASGSGKSSAVRAGLQPALARGALPGSDEWVAVDVRPGIDPLAALADALTDAAGRSGAAALAVELRTAPLGVVAARLFGGRRLVLHVDQFEEAWTTAPAEVRGRFLDLLVGAVTADDDAVSVVVSLRADYYGRTAEHPELAALMASAQVLVSAMTPAELRAAVELPARQAGLVLEPGLSQAVVDDVAGEPGALPLLSTAMRETWERRRGLSLTLAGYAETGGARRAIAHLADATMHEMDAGDQDVARRLLLRLAAPAADGGDVARPAPLSELVVDEITQRVLDRLVERRLVTAGATTVQVAHEALLREWPRLRTWLDADRDGRRLHQQLATAATEWQASGEDDGSLLRGVRLAAAADWRVDHAEALTENEARFLDASLALRERDMRRARRTTRRFQALAGVLLLLLVGAGVATFFAIDSSRTATQRANQAIARDLVNQSRTAVDSHLDTALLLAVEAYRRDPSVETQGALLTALDAARHLTGFLPELTSGITGSALSPDGRTLFVRTSSGQLLAYDPSDWAAEARTLTTGIGQYGALDVSHDGELLLYEAADGVHLRSLRGPASDTVLADGGFGARFSADGRFVASQEEESRDFLLAEVSTGTLVHRYPLDEGGALIVRPGRDEVVVTDNGDDTPHLQRLGLDGTPLAPPVEAPGFGTLDWRYVGDGSRLVVAASDGTVQILDAETLASVGTTRGTNENPAFALGLAPSGDTVAASSLDGSIAVYSIAPEGLFESTRTAALPGGPATPHWLGEERLLAITASTAAQFDLQDPHALAEPLLLPGSTSRLVETSAVTADGNRLLFVEAGRLRDADSGTGRTGSVDVALPFGEFGSFVLRVAPDGSAAALVGSPPGQQQDGTIPDEQTYRIVLVDTEAGRVTWTTEVTPPDISPTLAFSDDGGTLAVASGSEEVSLVDVGTARPGDEPISAGGPVSGLAWSDDGHTLFVGRTDGTLRLVDVAAGRSRDTVPLTPDLPLFALTVTPASDRLVVVDANGDVGVVDPGTGEVLRRLEIEGKSGAVGAALSPDREQLAVTSGDGLILIDLVTGRQVGPPLRTDAFESPMYLGSGDRLVTPSLPGPLLWDLDPAHWRATACRLAGRELTTGEWRTYLPGEPYRRTCSGE
jgi:class 3 adenylate cyclase/WD40 repeat protein